MRAFVLFRAFYHNPHSFSWSIIQCVLLWTAYINALHLCPPFTCSEQMAMGFGNCSSSDYDVLLTILGGSSVDVESICTSYNVSAIGPASAALAFEFREVGQFRSVNGSLWVLGEGNVEKRGQTSWRCDWRHGQDEGREYEAHKIERLTHSPAVSCHEYQSDWPATLVPESLNRYFMYLCRFKHG